MSAPELTRQDIETIIELIKSASDVTEFSLKFGATEIHISRNEGGGTPQFTASESAAAKAEAPAPRAPERKAAPAPVQAGANEVMIRAPMVGTFYRSPAPLEPPFVEIGQKVEPGTVLCIIEVMKLMNSLMAEHSGTVKAVLVADGETIEFGQPLIVLQTA